LATDLVEVRINQFKGDILAHPADYVVQQYVTHGSSYILADTPYFQLKATVAAHFGIHSTTVYMVGSGKLGFSIKPSRRYQKFGETSDIDLAIISKEMFEDIWKGVFQYQSEMAGWWPKSDKFLHYLFRGWIRPDLLPHGHSFSISKDWWDFFQGLTNSGEYGPYKIVAGVYHSMYFFENYQSICVDQCRQLLE
jgi:hypothetical protein